MSNETEFSRKMKRLAVNRALYDEVAKVLEQNKSERHLRGGEATKRRHLARTPQK
jgi:hypothetical protein